MSKKCYLVLIFLLVFSFKSFSTHIRAGEIIAKRVTSTIYEFTFIGYRDVDGVRFGQGKFSFGDGDVYGDDKDEKIPWITPVNLGNGVEKWQFSVTHEYSAASNYLVSYQEDFRNDNIQNISGSVNTTFYVETLVVIDPLIANSTPFFTVPPIDQGVVGAIFEHNPGAFDPDGDSLVYYFTTPKQGDQIDVSGYRSPANASFYEDYSKGNQAKNAEPKITIDRFDGTLIWDAPGGVGIPKNDKREFNVAFVVEEWRKINGKFIKLGFVTRDMQIIIWNYKNEPPDLEIPADTCVVAGDTVKSVVTATDPEGNQVKIEAYGGAFEKKPKASFKPFPPVYQDIPAKLNFEWVTKCEFVREKPYEIQFKATDNPVIPNLPKAPGLVDFETWKVTVLGPPPQGLKAKTIDGRRIQLDWDNYSCSNADSMQIWRRVDALSFDSTCVQGIPQNVDYKLIKTIPIIQTSYLDDNAGKRLPVGANYCYRLVASYPLPLGGKSVVSASSCDEIKVEAPVITHVDIQSTSMTNGKINIKWTPPYEIDTLQIKPPFTYELFRIEEGKPISLVKSQDTSFVDQKLNTKDIVYSYKVVFYDKFNGKIDSSDVASSVRLKLIPVVGAIQLNWNANVPWSNISKNYPYHYIYRDQADINFPEKFILIDSVNVLESSLNYTDKGKFKGIKLDDRKEYCYYVKAFGSYGNDKLPAPLINASQESCGTPNDSIPPCKPLSVSFDVKFACDNQLKNTPCGIDVFKNVFRWEINKDVSCGDDLDLFKIYYSVSGDSSTFKEIGKTRKNTFIHDDINSLAGCYYITAIDKSGNESKISDIICNDNCPRYLLPNVFTPNGDGKNDTFRPFKDAKRCPRFVESIFFKVFNKDGSKVFEYNSVDNENNILINWNGKSSNGNNLPADVYYYSIDVVFNQRKKENRNKFIKGWVQIIR